MTAQTFDLTVQPRGTLGGTYEAGSADATKNVYWYDLGGPQVELRASRSLFGITHTINFPAEHPVRLSTTNDGTHAGGVEYTNGVTTTTTSLTFSAKVFNGETPEYLYYYCDNHSGMGGYIHIKPYVYPASTAPYVPDVEGRDGTTTGPLEPFTPSPLNVEQAPESPKYGLRLLSPDNKIRLDTTSRVYRFHTFIYGVMGDSADVDFIDIPGLSDDGTWLVICDTEHSWDMFVQTLEIQPGRLKVYRQQGIGYNSDANYKYYLQIFRL